MGVFSALFSRKRPVAPFTQTSNISPQENYAGYTTLPNLPMSHGDFDPNPYRMHAPFALLREQRYLTTSAGVHRFDAGNEAVIGVKEESLQTYFDQKKVVEPQVVLVPAHGVMVPYTTYQHGWGQAYVEPTEMMRADISVASPAVLLSTPLHVYSTTHAVSGDRAPIMGGKAPKTKRGI